MKWDFFNKAQEITEEIHHIKRIIKTLNGAGLGIGLCYDSRFLGDGVTKFATIDKELKQIIVNYYEQRLEELEKEFEAL